MAKRKKSTARTSTDRQRERRYLRKRCELDARRLNLAGRDMMVAPDVRWYIGLCPSGREFVGQRMLAEWGAATYLPLSRRWRKVNRYRKEKTRFAYPAIAGCLFVGLTEGEEAWLDLFNLHAIRAVVSVVDRPAPVKGDVLLKFIDENWWYFGVSREQRFMRTGMEFKAGDRVRVADGPFVDHLVDVQSIERGVARILLPLLGSAQDIEIPVDYLEAV